MLIRWALIAVRMAQIPITVILQSSALPKIPKSGSVGKQMETNQMTEAPFWCPKCETLYENKCTCSRVKAEYEEGKFIVINKKHLELLEKVDV